MKSVFWGNYKGGVGKTTSTFQIAAHFADKGKKVLLLDLDPQCSLSNICCKGINTSVEKLKVDETFNYILELYVKEIGASKKFAFQIMTGTVCTETKNHLKGTIKHFKNNWKNSDLYFIPSSLSFTNARINELAQFMNANMFNIFLIKQFLSDVQSLGQDNDGNHIPLFDYVFFDCPPTTNILTQSVFLASDYYIIPTICDEISTKGVPDYITEIEKTRSKFSLHDELRGVLIEKAFPIKPRLVGVFETLYKNRAGITLNYEQIASLDRNIGSFESVLSQAKFATHRYNTSALTTQHIFNETIFHKDARASGESVAKNTANASLTEEYQDLASILMTMV
ncbi:MAG: AAA family ATPase [Treponema sp.]|nr:AAA family ATPase [Treponema sp.]